MAKRQSIVPTLWRYRRLLLLAAFALVIVAMALGLGKRFEARRNDAIRSGVTLPPLIQAPIDAPPTEQVIDSQKKIVMGRPGAYAQVKQVAEKVDPILRLAIEQSTIQPLVRQDA